MSSWTHCNHPPRSLSCHLYPIYLTAPLTMAENSYEDSIYVLWPPLSIHSDDHSPVSSQRDQAEKVTYLDLLERWIILLIWTVVQHFDTTWKLAPIGSALAMCAMTTYQMKRPTSRSKRPGRRVATFIYTKKYVVP